MKFPPGDVKKPKEIRVQTTEQLQLHVVSIIYSS